MFDITVVTPTYNRSKLLPRVWRSIENQRANFEWIAVDDGSTDDTSKIIESLSDSRVVYLKLPKNQGVNAARNAGVRVARGRYVVFLDSDDELFPGSLARMIEVMDGADANVGVAAFLCVMADTGKPLSQLMDGQVLGESDIVCHDALRDGDKIYVYRREIFDRFLLPEDLRGCEQVFIYEVSKKWNFLLVNQPMSIVHRDLDNLSNANSVIARSYDIAKSYERILNNHSEILNHEPRAVIRYLKKILYRYGVAGFRSDAWRIYTRLVHLAVSPRDRLEATGLLILSMLGLTVFERWRITKINRRLTIGDLE